MRDLDGRTAQEALDAGVPPKQVWAAGCAASSSSRRAER